METIHITERNAGSNKGRTERREAGRDGGREGGRNERTGRKGTFS